MKISHTAWFLFSILLCLSSCGGGSQSATTEPAADAPKVYHNGDLMVAGQRGAMYFQAPGGEKAFGGATFEFARDFYMGYAPVSKMVNGKELHGMLNLKGEEAVKIEHLGFVDLYEDGYFPINENGKAGYLDSTGKTVVPITYDEANGCYRGLFVMRKGLKYGVLNAKGEEITAFEFDKVYGYSEEGLMGVDKNYKMGFIDRSGKMVIPCNYASATSFTQGVSMARKSTKYGLINTKNEELTGFVFDEFMFETTTVEDAGSQTGFTNVGKRLVTEGGYIVVSKGGKWGAINPQGAEVIPFEFDYLGGKDAGGVNVGVGEKRGVYNLETHTTKWYGE